MKATTSGTALTGATITTYLCSDAAAGDMAKSYITHLQILEASQASMSLSLVARSPCIGTPTENVGWCI